jgi:hypothetical protein
VPTVPEEGVMSILEACTGYGELKNINGMKRIKAKRANKILGYVNLYFSLWDTF